MNLEFSIPLLIFCCFILQWLSWRVKLPAILFLLLFGIIIGPILNIFNPDKIFSSFFYPFVSLSVGLILFEGSLSLRFMEIKGLESVIRRLVTIGAVITIIITMVSTHYLLDLSWKISLLFGTITVVTGPTVITPILRIINPTTNISNILKWESILIDPIGAILAVLVYELIILGGETNGALHILFSLIKIVGIGVIIGTISGYLYGVSIKKHCIPEYLHKVSSLALVMIVFAFSNFLKNESGLLSVTIMGIVLANQKDVDLTELIDFKETISIILISILFICLASKVDLMELKSLGVKSIIVLFIMQFFSRPLSVLISTFGSRLKWNERHMIAWIAPRGIIAAAVSFLFSIGFEKNGLYGGSFLVPLTFEVIIFTVVLQGLTSRPIATLLKVSKKKPQGFLIIGSNLVSRTIASSLHENGIYTVIADPGWEGISIAKNMGLYTYYGNPMSEQADRNLDLTNIGRVLALTPIDWVNISSMLHFKMELGKENVYTINTIDPKNNVLRKKIDYKKYGHVLFSEEISYSKLHNLFSEGFLPKTTKITEKITINTLTKEGDIILLFAINPLNEVMIFNSSQKIRPKTGWRVIYIIKPI